MLTEKYLYSRGTCENSTMSYLFATIEEQFAQTACNVCPYKLPAPPPQRNAAPHLAQQLQALPAVHLVHEHVELIHTPHRGLDRRPEGGAEGEVQPEGGACWQTFCDMAPASPTVSAHRWCPPKKGNWGSQKPAWFEAPGAAATPLGNVAIWLPFSGQKRSSWQPRITFLFINSTYVIDDQMI